MTTVYPFIAAEELDKRIQILSKTITRDPDYGEEVADWSNVFAERWANVVQQLGAEKATANERIATRTYRIKLRTVPGLDGTMRVKLWDGKVLEIVSIVDTAVGDGHILTCEQYSSGG
jgi:SPP1 family predicted phage head-tail adaptor